MANFAASAGKRNCLRRPRRKIGDLLDKLKGIGL
jgi:hypothetical protein